MQRLYWFTVLLDIAMTWSGVGQAAGLAGWPDRWEGNLLWRIIMDRYGMAAWLGSAIVLAYSVLLLIRMLGRMFGKPIEDALLLIVIGMQIAAILSWLVWTGHHLYMLGKLW